MSSRSEIQQDNSKLLGKRSKSYHADNKIWQTKHKVFIIIQEMMPKEVMAFMRGQNDSENISHQRSMSIRSIKSINDDNVMHYKQFEKITHQILTELRMQFSLNIIMMKEILKNLNFNQEENLKSKIFDLLQIKDESINSISNLDRQKKAELNVEN